MNKISLLLLCVVLSSPLFLSAQRKKQEEKEKPASEETPNLSASTISGLSPRSIGPALTSGRIADFAVNPTDPAEYYVATASGGVWKTTNAGTTYEPIFDGEGSYSIGCVAIAPSNPHLVWVGTGENNAQRALGYGDGVYKSEDGGKSWKNMGLKESQHIGKIVIHPTDPNTVWVAAQGPVWNSGGERGLYKTTDGGKTWKLVLEISEHTGVNDIVIDPRNPMLLYASSWQRARKVWTFIGGGPESTIYKSTDGGETWEKSESGLPGGDKGRIGLAISPVNPDIVFAIVDAGDRGGFYRSTDRGASWVKMSGHSTSSNYYQEIIADPHNVDRIYSMDTWAMVSNDGGKSWNRLGEKSKHVDNHCMWIDPRDADHYLLGCDGGIYESWDAAATWQFKPNLPVTQFYKVATDNALPFYHVYGGTQDNFSIGGPSRTNSRNGIHNFDWYLTNGGDGFESQVDPNDPNIVYAQSQYGGLVRFDKKSGEGLDIQPAEGPGEAAYRWNWDAPLLISPHSPTRLYFAANKVFRSDDRGNTWKVISEDLSRQIDRNKLEIMGKVWSVDAVMKNASTTIYGNIVALSESPLTEGLLYAGTDDGLIHVSGNGGQSWARYATFPGIPENTYVNQLVASQHDANTVYAVFNNLKEGDFKPYVLKSTDKGATWTAIQGDLPERGTAFTLAEDFVKADLLFVGTEFGLFVTVNGGKAWLKMSGLPTIAVRDLEIQKREGDLVMATFGRGFYVLDDYSPLRHISEESLDKDAIIFPIKDALLYNPAAPLVYGGKGFQGESFFTTPNPEVGAVITYYLKEAPKTQKALRKEAEKKASEAGEAISYPSFEAMRAEDNEQGAFLLFTIRDSKGNIVAREQQAASAGVQRMTWQFQYPGKEPVSSGEFSNDGPTVLPGTYTVEMHMSQDGKLSQLVAPVSFEVVPLNNATLPAADKAEVLAFLNEVGDLGRVIWGTNALRREMSEKIPVLKNAVKGTPEVPIDMLERIRSLESKLTEVDRLLNGDRSVASREFETLPGITRRLSSVQWGLYGTSAAPTETMRMNYRIAREQFAPVYQTMTELVAEIAQIEQQLEQAGAPYTPGRMPKWDGK
ncbi:MAG: glycosyl hydrolase [Bacteroidia bacterium]|nr:glycosyl hydrolase [Bacteroidia bacterium]